MERNIAITRTLSRVSIQYCISENNHFACPQGTMPILRFIKLFGSSHRIQRNHKSAQYQKPKNGYAIIPENNDITIKPLHVLFFPKALSERGILRILSQFFLIQKIWIIHAISSIKMMRRISENPILKSINIGKVFSIEASTTI
jgi:hypothetical protein